MVLSLRTVIEHFQCLTSKIGHQHVHYQIYFQACPFLRCCTTVHFHATKYYSHHISTTNRHLIKVTRIISGHTFSCIAILNISLLQVLLKHFRSLYTTNVKLLSNICITILDITTLIVV